MKGPWTETFEKWWSETVPELWSLWSWVKGHWVEIAVVVFFLIVISIIWGVTEDFISAKRQEKKWQKQLKEWQEQAKESQKRNDE